MPIVRSALLALVLVGCASIGPESNPTAEPQTASPGQTLTTPTPGTTASAAVTPQVVQTDTPPPTKTPKPTRRPTPSPPPIAVDISIFVQTSDIPDPWYTNTDYTIPIYVAVAGADVPNVRAKVTIPEEAFATSFDTGPIATTDNYHHDVLFNLSAMGPATLTLAVRVPAGYEDVNRGNNKVTISINVQPKP